MSNSPNVYCLKKKNTGTGTLEVHILNGANNFQSFLLHTGSALNAADAAANFEFGLADFNRDGVLDLYCFKKRNTGTGMLEVHVLNGADNFQSFLLHTGTPITSKDAADNFVFALADYNGDGIPDLFCLKKKNTGSGTFEVHVLNGANNFQSFLLQTGTALAASDANANFSFSVADYNRDGHPDIYCFKKTNTGTNLLEVHVLNGADNFQSFLIHTGTLIGAEDAYTNYDFCVADYNGDGRQDIFCLKKTNTGTGTFEVHVLGLNNFQCFLMHTGTALGGADAAANFTFNLGPVSIK